MDNQNDNELQKSLEDKVFEYKLKKLQSALSDVMSSIVEKTAKEMTDKKYSLIDFAKMFKILTEEKAEVREEKKSPVMIYKISPCGCVRKVDGIN